MNLPLCLWYAGELPKLNAQESAALIMLAATIVVFRTFRERFLLVWILGWLAYGVSHWFAADATAIVADAVQRRPHRQIPLRGQVIGHAD